MREEESEMNAVECTPFTVTRRSACPQIYDGVPKGNTYAEDANCASAVSDEGANCN